MTATDDFVAHRDLLFTVAYQMLGSAADAEDVLQETWLRWADAMDGGAVDGGAVDGGAVDGDAVDGGAPDRVRDPRAYLVRITTRLSLNRLRALSRRREEYVGPWLPEPLLTAPDVADDVVLADSVSTAVMLVLETLSASERAVFVLREVFGLDYAEIAASVQKSEAAVRQLAHRARSHVAARRPRTRVDDAEGAAVIERFRVAAETGDLQQLMDVLAPDVVLVTDGGGRVQAALRPITGRDKVLRFLAAVQPESLELLPLRLNASPAVRFVVDGRTDGVGTMLVEDGVVTALYLVRNPDKLGALDGTRRLVR